MQLCFTARLCIIAAILITTTARLPAPISELETPTPTAGLPESGAAKLPPRIPPISTEVAGRIETRFSPWMQLEEFNKFSDHHEGTRVLIEGRLHEGNWEYRAIFEHVPLQGSSLYSYWGVGYTQRKFNEFNNRMISGGYEILSQQTFQDAGGYVLYQTGWVRKDQMPVARQCLQKILQ